MPPDSKAEKNLQNRVGFTPAATNFTRLEGARPDHVRKLFLLNVSQFDQRHVARALPTGKPI